MIIDQKQICWGLAVLLLVVACRQGVGECAELATEQQTLQLRRPEVPPADPGSGLTNPVDRILKSYFEDQKHEPAQIAADRVFARRVSLDLIGLVPTPEQLQAFVDDTRPDKRARLVRELLDDRAAYSAHWLTFWNDALRNAYLGTGFIDDGRKQVTGWLFRALYDNIPYDRFVHELINPVEGSEGFIKGIVWRGVVNASQRRELQAAQNISKVFLGINLKCASCHDHFLADWKLSDAYGLASVFADKPLEIYRCDKPTGEVAEIKFLFPELGQIDGAAPVGERRRQLADLVTSPKSSRLARTITNRIWSQLFGLGLIEPVDAMDNEPWNADLLDWLAADLVDHGYDLKHLLERICTSRAYQLVAVGAPLPGAEAGGFRGPLVRRMSAEQFVDAVARIIGLPRAVSSAMIIRDGRGQGGQLAAIAPAVAPPDEQPSLDAAKWIWDETADDPATAKETTRYFRKSFQLDEPPVKVIAVLSGVHRCRLFVNGKQAAEVRNWRQPTAVDLTDRMVTGANLLAVEVTFRNETRDKQGTTESRPGSGFLLFAVGTAGDGSSWSLGSDAGWLVTSEQVPGWETTALETKGWQHAVEVAEADGAPWKLENRLRSLLGLFDVRVRASLVVADPLMRALGRPNREQVVTRRDSWATMLQTLEFTNGRTLDELLKQGAKHRLERTGKDGADLVDQLYLAVLGRKPTAAERAISRESIGAHPTAEAIADLTWSLLMLPEFQLIY
jgi:hypothetical protein